MNFEENKETAPQQRPPVSGVYFLTGLAYGDLRQPVDDPRPVMIVPVAVCLN